MRPPRPAPPPVAPPGRGSGRPRIGRPRAGLRRLGLAGLLAAALPGCSLMVMGGKMLFGDPTETPVFEKVADVDLTDGEHTVLVLATSPESVKARHPEVDQELMRRVARQFRAAGVDVAPGDRVLDWVEERGGVWAESQLAPIAAEFEVDYIITIELDAFSAHERHSPDLLRGRAAGWIRAYGAEEGGGVLAHVLAGEFESVYPTHRPESLGNVSAKVFEERFLDRLSLQAAQRFIPHHRRDSIY